ncbi:MAG: response regulator transcription factor [Acidobacteria bacterium]|nr:response regulator transcription factor [Acidobacteriota bacterium]
MKKRPTIVLADDDPALVHQIRQLLLPEFEVVGAVGDGEALLVAGRNLHPDLFLLDISMPRLNGFQAARQLKREQPEARILFLTVHEEPVAVSAALAIGVAGYVLKRSAASDLIPALRQVFEGGRFVSVSVQ